MQELRAALVTPRSLRNAGIDDEAKLAMARQLECTTLYGGFRLDTASGLQVGHEVPIVQWQDGERPVVRSPERAESSLRHQLPTPGAASRPRE